MNVMVGKMDDNPAKPMLLHVDFQTVTNSKTTQLTILHACKLLWPDTNIYSKLVLLVSDQAAYMLNAGKELKGMKLIFPRLSHITCIAHAINLVCGSIRKEFFLVNKLFSDLKSWFSHSNKRKRDFKKRTRLAPPPFPIEVRWGSWIKCAIYHRSHLKAIQDHFDSITEPKDSKVLYRIKKILSGQKICNDVIRLTDRYQRIPSIIEKLEKEKLTKDDQLDLLNQVKIMIDKTSHRHILERSLSKNPDLISFTSEDNSFDDRVKRTYAPLTSCSVERSFSVYRSVLRENRTNFTSNNLRSTMLVKCNNFIS